MQEQLNKQEALKMLVSLMTKTNGENTLDNTLQVRAKEGTGESITIPKGMNKLEASKQLRMQWEDEENVIDMIKEFEGWNGMDVLVAIKKVCEKTFGWMNAKPKPTFFGPQNPKNISINTGYDEHGKMTKETCFYGNFNIAPWENAEASVNMSFGEASISIEIKKKYKERVEKFFESIEQHLSENSIYKAKAVRVTQNGLEFIQNKGTDNIILNEDEESIVDNFVIKPLGKEGKRCILFAGKYGTGKTETAIRVGKEGNKKGLTFFYCKDPEMFTDLLGIAVNYQPCVIFMEDLDAIGSGEERSKDINDMLNTLDGVETKGRDITTIFTTNHEDRLNKALRRPGRIDLIIKFKDCEKSTVEKIYRSYFSGLLGADTLDYKDLVDKTPGAQGAVIAEIAKRAIRLMINDGGSLTNDMVKASINSMKHQIDFMNADPEKNVKPHVRAFEDVVKYIGLRSAAIYDEEH